MFRAGRSRWFAVSAGLVLVASACNSPGSTNATTLEAGPPPVLVPEGSVPPVNQTTARLQEPSPPLDPAPLATVAGGYTAVSAGYGHSCGLRADGTVVCWGDDNFWGQLDAPAGAFAAVDVGSGHSCGLRTNGTIQCWSWITNLPEGVRWAA